MNGKSIEDRIQAYEEDKEFNSTPLMWAIREKDSEVIDRLVGRMSQSELREELDKRDSWGRTPLHLACSYRPKLEIIESLLDAGANLQVRNNNEETPLLKAIQTADPDVVRLLLQHGAHVDGKDGEEALEVAESYGLRAIAALLRQAGAGK